MALQHLNDPANPTPNFDFWFDQGPFSGIGSFVADLARIVLATCEADFGRLAALFGHADRFGAANRIRVVLDANLGMFSGGTIAQNAGFETEGKTTISIAATASVFPRNISGAQFNDALRAAFVAELAEVFLSLRGQDTATLNPGWSDGEAVSRVFAAWLHPVGYYEVLGRTVAGLSQPLFPASHWLNDYPQRSNDVTTPVERDTLPVSIGCGILFLHYLHTQRRRSWSDIVAAFGHSLGSTYENLGFGAAGDAFTTFDSIVGRVFPPRSDANAPGYDLPIEDVFPLLDPKRCRLELVVGPPGGAIAGADPLKQDWVDVRPFPLCPVGHYHYAIRPATASVDVTATVRGFGQPRFSWKVEGQPVTGDRYVPTPISFTAAGWDDDPLDPEHLVSTTAQVSAAGEVRSTGWNSSSLTLAIRSDASTPAHMGASVEVEVVEATAQEVSVAQSAWAAIDTKLLTWDPPFDEDRKRCADRLRDLMRRYNHLREIVLLRTLPDPPPPLVVHGLEIAARIEDELRVLAEHDPELAVALRERFQIPGRG